MNFSAIPAGGLSLLRSHEEDRNKTSSNTAILCRLNTDLLGDVRAASKTQDGLQLITGSQPKLRLGTRTFDLSISTETFRHDLYAVFPSSSTQAKLAGTITHRASLHRGKDVPDSGTDAALAALQNKLAILKEEKQATQTNITGAVVPVPNGSRGGVLKSQHARQHILSKPTSPALSSTPASRLHNAPTSAPLIGSDPRSRAMRTVVLHLLAIKPLSQHDIVRQTHIPRLELDSILQGVATSVDGKWQLNGKAYRELDVFKFRYTSTSNRQAAIDNAIKAFDRARLGRDDKLWQLLLPESQRGQGICLSKLQLGPQNTARVLTPRQGASPEATTDNDTANATPRLGPAPSPRVVSKGAALNKRLFAKDPLKQRAAEQAKEKKRKERETVKATTSDVEGGKPLRKKQTTATNNPKIKSAELVHSSDDESDVLTDPKAATTKVPKKEKPSANVVERKATTSKTKAGTVSRTEPHDKSSTSSDNTPIAKLKTLATNRSQLPEKPSRPTPISTNKASLKDKGSKGALSAPTSAQHAKTQLSPQKNDSRPTVPSPLGAARPRVASDVSDRAAVGVQRIRQGAERPKGPSFTNGIHNGQSTPTQKHVTASKPSSQSYGVRPRENEKATSYPLKRKAEVVSTPDLRGPSAVHASKHRKTDSSSSLSSPSDTFSVNGHANHIMKSDTSSSEEGSIVLENISFDQGVKVTTSFEKWYPLYAKTYDDQDERRRRGQLVTREEHDHLMEMHNRLSELKAQMYAASARQHIDE